MVPRAVGERAIVTDGYRAQAVRSVQVTAHTKMLMSNSEL